MAGRPSGSRGDFVFFTPTPPAEETLLASSTELFVRPVEASRSAKQMLADRIFQCLIRRAPENGFQAAHISRTSERTDSFLSGKIKDTG